MPGIGVIQATEFAHDLADEPDPGRVNASVRPPRSPDRSVEEEPVIRSHRRDEPGRRAAFRILTAVIISGSGLGIALATAGPSTPTRTATESFDGPVRPPAPATAPTHATTARRAGHLGRGRARAPPPPSRPRSRSCRRVRPAGGPRTAANVAPATTMPTTTAPSATTPPATTPPADHAAGDRDAVRPPTPTEPPTTDDATGDPTPTAGSDPTPPASPTTSPTPTTTRRPARARPDPGPGRLSSDGLGRRD